MQRGVLVKVRDTPSSWAHLGRFARLVLFRAAVGLRRIQTERDHFPLQAFRFLAVLPGFPKLILGYSLEGLMYAARGPVHFNAFDLRGLSQPDVLLKRRGSKRPAAPHGAVNRPRRIAFVFHDDFNSRANRRTVALDAHQLEINPIVSARRVCEQPQSMAVSGSRPSGFGHNVLVPAALQIRGSDSVS